jgi:CheY-like chemotaxis protein
MRDDARRNVLVVDDDRDVRDTVAEVLEDAGYLVTTAEDGWAALSHLRKSTKLPAVILLDLMMPTMDGWQFRAEQKKDPRLSPIPIVAFSARDHARPLDAADWLRKPVALDTLLHVVARFCE